mmetsp:Transcript_31742/g.61380  ORF Transcript_31742/g.61380 Transcript_31742/m.61380 type:complete len:105 (-) Transcript_31742:44-358(-)
MMSGYNWTGYLAGFAIWHAASEAGTDTYLKSGCPEATCLEHRPGTLCVFCPSLQAKRVATKTAEVAARLVGKPNIGPQVAPTPWSLFAGAGVATRQSVTSIALE